MRSIKNYGKDGATSGESDLVSAAKSASNKYAGMNEQELMRALMQQVAASKSNGTFSAEQLDSFAQFVMPTLDESARERLQQLIDMIKG